ncbi:MAG: hypothetical protein KDD59_08890 [Bdellovibrionales bacterium]|nr:hypothetical protein [Bdellovibrionales bacterium]
MGSFLLSLASVILFCLCSHQLARAVVRPAVLVSVPNFSKRALKIERYYRILAWGLMSAVLMVSMILSFLETFQIFL